MYIAFDLHLFQHKNAKKKKKNEQNIEDVKQETWVFCN